MSDEEVPLRAEVPVPLRLEALSFDLALADLPRHVAIEADDGSVAVLETRGDGTYHLTHQGRQDPVVLRKQRPDLELAELALRGLDARPVRAFALPKGTMSTRYSLRGTLLASLVTLLCLALITGVLLSGLPSNLAALLVAILLLTAIAVPVMRYRSHRSAGHRFTTAHGAYPLDKLLDTRPAQRAAEVRVHRIKEKYGALLSDLCFRLEYPALFDPAQPPTTRLTAALIAWDSRPRELTAAEITDLAGEVQLAFDTAKAHAETVGLTHLPPAARQPIARAVKAARLAEATKGPERVAALHQVSAILASLALYYLPSPAQARDMVEGRTVLALPGRLDPEAR